MGNKKVAALLFPALFACAGSGAQGLSQPQVLLTSRENSNVPEEMFSCSDQVYAYVSLAGQPGGDHLVKSVWTGPEGAVQEFAQDIHIQAGIRQRTRSWLSFEAPAGSLFDDFTFGGDYGRTPPPVRGEWRLEVFLDRSLLAAKRFTVKCDR